MATVAQPVITPKLTPAPEKDEQQDKLAKLDPQAWAEEIRLRRGDIYGMESRLAFVGTHEGWTRRWCVDYEDNLPRRLAQGWRHVLRKEVDMSMNIGYGNTDVGDQVSIVTTMGDGKAVRQYLMEIPTEIAEEILEKTSGQKVRAFEQAVRRGTVGVTSPATYNPGETPGSAYYQGVHNGIGHKQQ